MGLFSPSSRRFDALSEAFDSEVRQLASRGLAEFTITVREQDWGRLDRALPPLVERIQILGHSVSNVNHEQWSGIAYITVRSSAPAGVQDAQAGTAGLEMTPDQLMSVAAWMEREFGKRTSGAAWKIYMRRLELGYSLPDGLEQGIRFWLNAYPALCAAILGKSAIPEPRLAIVCADECQLIVNPNDPAQSRAANTVKENLLT
jgi:hypothetical protein